MAPTSGFIDDLTSLDTQSTGDSDMQGPIFSMLRAVCYRSGLLVSAPADPTGRGSTEGATWAHPLTGGVRFRHDFNA